MESRLRGRPFGWVMHIGPHQTVQAEAPCRPLRRGMLQFKKVVLSTSFPFGVVRRIIEFELPGRILVYPQLWRINRRIMHRLSIAEPLGRHRQDRGGGQEEFYGLRHYRAGDNPKSIDWKRTAKSGQLVCREMTLPSPPRVMVALDLSTPDREVPKPSRFILADWFGRRRPNGRTGQQADPAPDRVETTISLAASVVCEAHFYGCPVGLVVLGVVCTAFPIHHSLPHRMKMLETLSLMNPRRRCRPTRP